MIVSANIATYNGRQEFLAKTIESLKMQSIPFDVIRVWYNGYVPEKADVEQHYNGFDYTDRGKFIWLDNIRITGEHEIYFSCDDDLIYPADYVSHTLEQMKRYPKHVVSYHGRKLRGAGKNYYFEHKSFNFLTTIKEDNLVEVPGTGVTCFDTRDFIPDIIQYNDNCMADVLMGLEMAKKGVPGVCLAHERGWIESQPVEETIYKTHSRNCRKQSRYADLIWHTLKKQS